MGYLRCLALIVVLACVAMAANADSWTIYLRNGDRLSGVIKSEDARELILTTPWKQEIKLPLDQISRREKLPVAAAAPGTALAGSNSPPVAASASTNKVSPAMKAALNAVGVKPTSPKFWAGDIVLGMNLAFSEKHKQDYNGHAKLTYGRPGFRHILDYDFSYGKVDGQTSAERMDGSSKMDFDIGPRWYVYNIMSAGYDRIRKVDYRFEIGPGAGYHLIKRTNFVFNFEAGIDYQAQHLQDNSHPDVFFYRFAENFNWQIASKVSLDEKFEYFPRVENLPEYKMRFESNLRYALGSYLSLVLTVIDLFEKQPATGVSPNDLQVRSALGIKF
ncbi:MAG TPA: DUF481 domain-containing protein [Verrucomicrobiae bacterium]|jgi:putative salt-induced outer membrane protein